MLDSVDNNNLFRGVLPNILAPFIGESLYGYLLRLDIINNFWPGTILDIINRHSTSKVCMNRPGLFLCGTVFDISSLSALVNLSFEHISCTTLTPSIKRIFRIDKVYPDLIGYSTNFKICPECIKQCTFPIIHSFSNITTCLVHNLELQSKCVCGYKTVLFSSGPKPFFCPKCNNPYMNLNYISIDPKSEMYKREEFYHKSYSSILFDKINFVHDTEDLPEGLEGRFQHLCYFNNISSMYFKKEYGYDAANMKNGHGPNNLSLSRILDILYKLGYTPQEFRDLKYSNKFKKIPFIHKNNSDTNIQSTCPNIYCIHYNTKGDNVALYGKKRLPSGKVITEEFCKTCGTRFFKDNIIQSYDYNPGLRQSDIEKARLRIPKWQEALSIVCIEIINKRKPITLTECFKKANIPIGKTYFIDRLGLIQILEKYAAIQKNDFKKWSQELDPPDAAEFLRRIYKRKRR